MPYAQVESYRYYLKDSLYLLLCRFIMEGSRDIGGFNLTIGEADRKIVVDGSTYKLVKRSTGQLHEKPGINLVFHDEHELVFGNPVENRIVAMIHVYVKETTNGTVDDRTMDKLKFFVDGAFAEGATPIWDMTFVPPQNLRRQARWMKNEKLWEDLTDTRTDSYIHCVRRMSFDFRSDTLS